MEWIGANTFKYLQKFRSAAVERASNDGKSAGRKVHLRSSFRRRSSLFRCSSVAYPHHAGEAYSREATVVTLQLQQDAAPGNQGHATIVYGRANFEDEHDETARPVWSPIDSCGLRLHIRKLMFNQSAPHSFATFCSVRRLQLGIRLHTYKT